TAEQMLAQVRFVLGRRPEIIHSRKLKVHFARMGEPSLNPAVLEALEQLPSVLPVPGLLPCIASIAPKGTMRFFEDLLEIRKRVYEKHDFQIQISVNSTDPAIRQFLTPTPLLDLETIATLGERFHLKGSRKVVLNFALGSTTWLDVDLLSRTFDNNHFAIKLTPLNPTIRSKNNNLSTVISATAPNAAAQLVHNLRQKNFDTIVSIGEPDEIRIGSNCGQAVFLHLETEAQSAIN
ncbi:MAG: radical SAM protein, partial [Pseudomonadota bacterium]